MPLRFPLINVKDNFNQTDVLLSCTHTDDHPNSAPNNASGSQLTKPDAVSTVPSTVRGDWVLFHPVYTQEELKAVEVNMPGSFKPSYNNLPC